MDELDLEMIRYMNTNLEYNFYVASMYNTILYIDSIQNVYKKIIKDHQDIIIEYADEKYKQNGSKFVSLKIVGYLYKQIHRCSFVCVTMVVDVLQHTTNKMDKIHNINTDWFDFEQKHVDSSFLFIKKID